MNAHILFEEWIEVGGYEGQYAVSSHGRVMSLERSVCRVDGKGCRILPEKILIQYDSWQGYKQVWFSRPGEKHRKRRVHRLVAEAFLPNLGNLPIVNHIDGDKGNCHLANLEWVSESDNCRHYHEKIKPAVATDTPIRPEDIPF